MIFTQNEYISTILDHLDRRPTSVWIASYNLHVGISRSASVFDKSVAHKLVSDINTTTKSSRIMVGFPLDKIATYSDRMTNAAEYFRNITWRTKANCHLKCWIFFYGNRRSAISIAGGRNLGDSEWADLSLVLTSPQTQKLIAFYDSLWINSRQIKITEGFTVRGEGNNG